MPFAAATIPVDPFKISHSQQEVDDLKTLLRLSPSLNIETYENRPERNTEFGPSFSWMREMRDAWLDLDWQAEEKELNEDPHFIAKVPDVDPKTGKEETFDVHFVGFESPEPDAIPVIIMHGWPGSFYEILPLVKRLRKSGRAMNIIVPSLIGYSYSSPPPLDREFGAESTARVFNSLMKGLGYDEYWVQGGDLGSLLARLMAISYSPLNQSLPRPSLPVNNLVPRVKSPTWYTSLTDPLVLSESDKKGQERTAWFNDTATGYSVEHATRPATIGYAVASSPIALLAWVGEKFQHWTDKTPTQRHMLVWLTIYWLTQSYPTSIFYYRDPLMKLKLTVQPGEGRRDLSVDLEGLYVDKPLGFSRFPLDLGVAPKRWTEATGKLVFYKEHTEGGHFAASEQPDALAKDFNNFLGIVLGGQ